MYDYKEIIKSDVREWMDDNKDELKGLDRIDMFNVVYDSCWVDDSVTGNASGSYTFSRWEARKNFFEDEDADEYVSQMIEDGFSNEEEIGKLVASSNWEKLDVYIRCWLLNQCVSEIMDEIFDD